MCQTQACMCLGSTTEPKHNIIFVKKLLSIKFSYNLQINIKAYFVIKSVIKKFLFNYFI